MVESRWTLRRHWWLVAVVAGMLLGPLDLWGQVASPYPWAHLFNSPSMWAAAAFAYGRWVAASKAASVGGVILLVVAVEMYYLVDVLVRDASRQNLTSPTALVWLVAGVAAGLVFGTAGAWASQRSGWRAVLGCAALPAVFGAEAVHNLLRVTNDPPQGRPDDLGQFAVLLAVLSISTLVVLLRGVDRRAAGLVVATAVVGAIVGGVAVNTRDGSQEVCRWCNTEDGDVRRLICAVAACDEDEERHEVGWNCREEERARHECGGRWSCGQRPRRGADRPTRPTRRTRRNRASRRHRPALQSTPCVANEVRARRARPDLHIDLRRRAVASLGTAHSGRC